MIHTVRGDLGRLQARCSSPWAQGGQPRWSEVQPWLVVGVQRGKTSWAASLDIATHASTGANQTRWSGPEQGWPGGKATLWRSSPNSSVRTSQIAWFAWGSPTAFHAIFGAKSESSSLGLHRDSFVGGEGHRKWVNGRARVEGGEAIGEGKEKKDGRRREKGEIIVFV